MIRLQNVSKKYGTGESALSDLSLIIEKGEFAFLVGPSGSGKTTLLRLLTREMLPTEGSIYINDLDIVSLPKSKVPHLRKKIGVIFQDLKLLADRTIFENIILPLEMGNVEKSEAIRKVDTILEQVGVATHRNKFPVQLSGGELQRVAIARALVFSPDILLADEPTGNLDNATSWEIVKLLQDINEKGTTVIMATHNTDIINSLLKRVLMLEKGKLVKDEKKGSAKHPKGTSFPEAAQTSEKKDEGKVEEVKIETTSNAANAKNEDEGGKNG
jgi:cell division transport system ATP-binding protein